MPFRRLADRARRANLIRVLTLYLSACFVALQVVDMFSERLALPRSSFTVTLVAAIVGLPIVMLITLARVGAVPAEERAPAEQRHWLTWQRVGFSVVALFALWGIVVAGWLLLGPSTSEGASEEAAQGTLIVTTSPAADIAVSHDSITHELRSGEALSLPVGEYVVSIKAAGHNPVELLAQVGANAPVRVPVALVRATAATADMVRVPGNDSIRAFLIDKYEVTNEQYLEFIRAGGYQQAALRRFVDATGAPGPRGWSGGLYPQGTGKHPVVGVSWFEANAYAQWRGKQLPTREQWWHAALRPGYTLPWGTAPDSSNQRANFGLEGAAPVGTRVRGVSHVGAHDMAGNVREWLRNGSKDANKRVAVGGSWQDPTYLFDRQWVEEFPADFANDFIGFRCIREL